MSFECIFLFCSSLSVILCVGWVCVCVCVSKSVCMYLCVVCVFVMSMRCACSWCVCDVCVRLSVVSVWLL